MKEPMMKTSKRGQFEGLGRPSPFHSEQDLNRKHVTLLFGDVVGSTETLAEVGDLKWMELVKGYYATIRRECRRFGGHHLTTTGDGFLAAFANTREALNCASAILQAVKLIGLKLRIGIHAGECLDMGEQLVGLTVHVGARIAAAAGADEVLVSDSAKSQISDSNIRFLERGSYNLRGVPGEWRLFAAK